MARGQSKGKGEEERKRDGRQHNRLDRARFVDSLNATEDREMCKCIWQYHPWFSDDRQC